MASTLVQYMKNEPITWKKWFFSQTYSKYFVEIDDDYLKNTFNYYGFRQKVSDFALSLNCIQGEYTPTDIRPQFWPSSIDKTSFLLFGLLHARYLQTQSGIEKMYSKYQDHCFEKCPRSLCNGFQCIPVGISDDTMHSSIKFYCPLCQNVYEPYDVESSIIDGAFFGKSWVAPFLEKYKSVLPKEPKDQYVPKLFGFSIVDTLEGYRSFFK